MYLPRRNQSTALALGVLLVFASASAPAQEPAPASEAAAQNEAAPPDAAGNDEFVDELDSFNDEPPPPAVWDPIEKVNRGIFWFNDKLYVYLLKPVAKAYRVVPETARISVANFFYNWTTPIRMVNALLQAKINDAGNELGRFVINTTLGIGGLFDPAREVGGLRRKDEDFGQTLGTWGVGPGPYLVLPFLGPSNLRDGVGRLGDTALDPFNAKLEERDYYIVKTYDVVNDLSLDKDTYEAIKKNSLDPYFFIRDAYMQSRAGKVKQ